MLFVGLLTSTLASRAQRQAELSRRNERKMEAVNRLSRQLAEAIHQKDLVPAVESATSEVLGGNCILFLPDVQRQIRPVISDRFAFGAEPTEVATAQWVLDHDQKAGAGTDTLPNASAAYFPLKTGNQSLGVLGIQHPDPRSLKIPEVRELAETICSQIAVSIERNRLIEETRHQAIQVETEKLRSSLLASISHDLRTPLAAIAGASEGLLKSSTNSFSEETRSELLESIYDESHRLTRLVENILHMTRLSSGEVQIAKDWHSLEDIVGSALNRLSTLLEGRSVETHLPPEEVFVFVDPVLLEQVLVNLIENADRYTPVSGRILIAASDQSEETLISVLDEGMGIPHGEEERIFERFQRGLTTRLDTRGTGLGLAICRAITEAHGGTISASNRTEGGAIFTVRLPKEGSPPPTLDDSFVEVTEP
jgi:two-component system, OmpR family, sensor histidine kinase KdpD